MLHTLFVEISETPEHHAIVMFCSAGMFAFKYDFD